MKLFCTFALLGALLLTHSAQASDACDPFPTIASQVKDSAAICVTYETVPYSNGDSYIVKVSCDGLLLWTSYRDNAHCIDDDAINKEETLLASKMMKKGFRLSGCETKQGMQVNQDLKKGHFKACTFTRNEY